MLRVYPKRRAEPSYCLGGRKEQIRGLELVRETVVHRAHFIPFSHSPEASTLGPDLTPNYLCNLRRAPKRLWASASLCNGGNSTCSACIITTVLLWTSSERMPVNFVWASSYTGVRSGSNKKMAGNLSPPWTSSDAVSKARSCFPSSSVCHLGISQAGMQNQVPRAFPPKAPGKMASQG